MIYIEGAKAVSTTINTGARLFADAGRAAVEGTSPVAVARLIAGHGNIQECIDNHPLVATIGGMGLILGHFWGVAAPLAVAGLGLEAVIAVTGGRTRTAEQAATEAATAYRRNLKPCIAEMPKFPPPIPGMTHNDFQTR